MLIPISIRPALTHRKTHSGTIHSGAVPMTAGGIQKRNPPGTIRLVYQNQNQHQSSSTELGGGGWSAKDVVGLAEEAGLRVSDFRTSLQDELSESTTPTAHTPSTSPVLDRAGERRGSISRRVTSTLLSRTNSGARSRHSRTSSKSSGSPLMNNSPVVPISHPTSKRTAIGMSAQELLARLAGADRRGGKGPDDLPLLVVDVRTLSAFLGDAGRIRTSV